MEEPQVSNPFRKAATEVAYHRLKKIEQFVHL